MGVFFFFMNEEKRHHLSSTGVSSSHDISCYKLLGLIAHAVMRCLASPGKGLNELVPVMNDDMTTFFFSLHCSWL